MERQLKAANIVLSEDGDALCEAQLHAYFKHTCSVMRGHLPNTSWPRHRRRSEISVDALLCTCPYFMMHAECEHALYVGALTEPAVAEGLKKIPTQRPRGRKRKAASLTKAVRDSGAD